jgi:TPR repeat protein
VRRHSPHYASVRRAMQVSSLAAAALMFVSAANADTVKGAVSLNSVPTPIGRDGRLKPTSVVRLAASSDMEICVNCLDDAVAAEDSCDKAAADPADPKRPDDTAGVPFDRIDAARAVQECLKAANIISGEPRLLYELGRALDAAKRYDEAIGFYRRAADAGYAIAMASLGLHYEEGQGVNKDLSVAKDWYQKAVDGGYNNAKGNVKSIKQASASGQNQTRTSQSDIVLDLNGLIDLRKPTAKNAANAPSVASDEDTLHSAKSPDGSATASCDQDAANPTDPKLPNNVAGVAFDKIDAGAGTIEVCRSAVTNNPDEPRFKYELGRALDAAKRYDEAMSYYQKAADAGYAAAMANIGYNYEHGIGVSKDLSTAKGWYQKAANAGDEHARNNVSDIDKALMAATPPAPATPAEPAALPAPSDSSQTASNDGPAILNRLSSHPWFDMADKSCTIEFKGNIIDYSDCHAWNFVGITESTTADHDVDLFSTDGAAYQAKVIFFGGRVSFQLLHNHCLSGDFFCSFGLQRYDMRLPPIPPD